MSIQLLLQKKGTIVHDINPEASLGECADLLHTRHIGALLVRHRGGRMEGIVTERDIMRELSEKRGQIWHLKVRDIMTPSDRLVTAGIEDTIENLMTRITERRVRHVPIMDGTEVAGIVSIGDVVKYLLEEAQLENEQMRGYIYGFQSV